MFKLPYKLTVVILILIIAVTIPGQSNPQSSGQTSTATGSKLTGEKTSAVNSLNELKQTRTVIQNADDLSEETKKSILSYLDSAILFREQEIELKNETEDINRMVKAAPKRIKAIETEFDQPLPPLEDVVALAAGMTPEQREQRLRSLQTDLSNANNDLNRSTERLGNLKDMPARLQQEIANSKKRLLVIAGELKAIPAQDEPPRLTNARQAILMAEQAKIRAEIVTKQVRIGNHAILTSLVTAERDLAARSVARLEALVKNWQAEVQRTRELEAQQKREAAEQAKRFTSDLPSPIQKEFEFNIELGKMLETVTDDEASIVENLESRKAVLKHLVEDFALDQEQVKYPTRNESVGLALREQRMRLPALEDFRQQSNRRLDKMGEIRSIQLNLDRQRRELANTDQVIDAILSSESLPEDANVDALRTELRGLLSDRRELIKKLQAGYQRLFKDLQERELIEQQIAAEAEKQAKFLDERLLWFRSVKKIGLQDFRDIPIALKWFSNPTNWRLVLHDLRRSIVDNTLIWILVLVISFTAFGVQRRVHRDLSKIALKVYSVKTDNFVLTLRAMGYSARVALGWPLLMVFSGWQLQQLPTAPDFTNSVAAGLLFAGWIMAVGLFLYEFCWKEGVAKVHFKWPESGRKTLRHSLPWLILVFAALSFVIITVQSNNDPVYMNSLGRLTLMVLMGCFSFWYIHRVSGSGPLIFQLTTRRSNWLLRMRFLWYGVAIGIPLFLAILAGIGYLYTAFALYLSLCKTIALMLGLVILKDIVLRWIYITQRRLAFEEIQRRNEALAENPDLAGESTGAVGGEGMVVEEPEINLDLLYEKNTALLHTLIFFSLLTGLWMIWADVLPALNFLQNVELWSYSSEVDGVRTMVPITLANLVVAIIVAIVTAVAAKNLPGLLEIVLINWFPLEAGLRHAISTIFNYIITAIGIVITMTIIGIKWSNIQWLVAALGVGVGFGLQEVVANFICGLIVLFERPYRIGDTITIGDITGTVTRIQIRATTIMDWDRKELIVPNKEFITGRLVNWSLSDNIIRFRIPVGIAYGSDTAKAEKLLLKTAKANPMVLKNPEPQAVFLGFGDNSLNFDLRVFVNGINDWIPMLHKMNRTIDQEFRKAGVTIAFPQRDVHLDQIGPLEVRVVSEDQDSKN